MSTYDEPEDDEEDYIDDDNAFVAGVVLILCKATSQGFLTDNQAQFLMRNISISCESCGHSLEVSEQCIEEYNMAKALESLVQEQDGE